MKDRSLDGRKLRFFQQRLLAWYEEHGRPLTWREPSATLFVQVIAEILLQRTPAERVDRALTRLVETFKTWEAIAQATDDDLEVHLKPLGLWRRRSAALRRLAAEMHRRGGVFPRDRDELESIPAVGQYIANAILLLAHADPQPLLDVNMARVLERFFGPRHLVDIRYDPHLQKLSRAVLQGVDARRMNWAILDFAAAVCRISTPLCKECPLKTRCLYFRQARPTSSRNLRG